MPHVHWDSGRPRPKNLGHEDLAAMDCLEILEHLRDFFGVVDIKPINRDITHIHEPPITTKGDPYLRNVCDYWYADSVYPTAGEGAYLNAPDYHSVMMVMNRKECELQLKQVMDADVVTSF